MNHSQALRLALDALGKLSIGYHVDAVELNDLIATLEAALEQPEPPPEAQTEAEKIAYCAGWWAAMAAKAKEQPEQEPVAWTTKGQIKAMESGFQHYIQGRVPRFVSPSENDVALYTHPPRREWRGLTEEEIYPLYSEPSSDAEMVEFARAIEAALRSKNHA